MSQNPNTIFFAPSRVCPLPTNSNSAVPVPTPIKDVEFKGPLSFCSNFYKCKCEYDGYIYPSSEHAFQAAKSLDKDIRKKISDIESPVEAKRFAKTIALRPNWDEIRVDIMEEILRSKFKNQALRDKLVGTGDMPLVEVNYWGDKFWGECPRGQGENNLGKLLMKLREEFISGVVSELTVYQKLDKIKNAIEWLEIHLNEQPYKDDVMSYIKNNSEGCWT